MAMLYPSCGAHAREVRGAGVNVLTARELKRLLLAQAIVCVRLPDGGTLVYDQDALTKRLNANKRGTVLMREKLSAAGVLRGPIVLLTSGESVSA